MDVENSISTNTTPGLFKQSSVSALETEQFVRGGGCEHHQPETRPQDSYLTKVNKWTFWFLSDTRTERAFRFASMVPLAVYFSYSKAIPSGSGQLCIVIYTILSALVPPSCSMIPVLWFLAVPSVLLTLAILTICWVFAAQTYENAWSQGSVDLSIALTLALTLVLAANFRIGALSSVMLIPYYVLTYALAYGLIQSTEIIRRGVQVEIPVDMLKSHQLNLLGNLQALGGLLPHFVEGLRNKLEEALTLVFFKNLDRELVVPQGVKALGIYPGIGSLQGFRLKLTGSLAQGLKILAPGGYQFLRLFWEGKYEAGVLFGVFSHALTALGLYCLAQLLPPLRLMRHQFAQGASRIVDGIKFLVDCQPPVLKHKLSLINQTVDTSDKDRMVVLTQQGVEVLKTPMVLSMFDELWTSPLGVNTFTACPALLSTLKKGGILTFVSQDCLSFLRSNVLLATKDEHVADLESNRVEIYERIQLVLPLKGTVIGDRAGEQVHAKLVGDLQSRLDQLDSPSSDVKFSSEVGVPGVVTEGDQLSFENIKAFLMHEYLTAWPKKIGSMALERAALGQKRGLGRLLISVGSWLSLMALMVFSLFKPYVLAAKNLRALFIAEKPGRVAQDKSGSSGWVRQLSRLQFPRMTARRSSSDSEGQSGSREFIYQKERGGVDDAGEISLDFKQVELIVTKEELKRAQPLCLEKTEGGSLRVVLNPFVGRFGNHRISDWHYLWFILRLSVGSILLTTLQVFVRGWRTLSLTGTNRPSSPIPIIPATAVDWNNLISTKYGPWSTLGFVTSITMTASGTIKRSALRCIGVLLGSFSAFLLLRISTKNALIHGVWLTCFDFVAVWLSCDPGLPASGFNPAWGYAAQLFTYQQAIIASAVYLGQVDRDEVVVARLVGQAVGISLALLLSLVIVPTRPNDGAKLHIVDCLHDMNQVRSVSSQIIRIHYAGIEEKNFAESDLYDELVTHQREHLRLATDRIARAREIIKDNQLLHNSWFSPSCLDTQEAVVLIVNSLERLVVVSEAWLPHLWNVTSSSRSNLALDSQVVNEKALRTQKLSSLLAVANRFLQEVLDDSRKLPWRQLRWEDPNDFRVLREGLQARMEELLVVCGEPVGVALRMVPADKLINGMASGHSKLSPIEIIWLMNLLEIKELSRIAAAIETIIRS